MTRKIVSGVTKYTEEKDDGEVVDCLKVHYTDGTSKRFHGCRMGVFVQ